MPIANAFVTVRAPQAAGRLAAAARAKDESCFEAYAVEAEAWTRLRDWERQKVVSEAALARFQGHPDLAQIEEPYLVAHGKAGVVLKRLEDELSAALAAGREPEPGLLKELIAFYIEVEGRKERLAGLLAKADADPRDAVSAFFAGVLLHYDKEFERSRRYLEPLLARFPKEPRLYIYLAMDAFNLGDAPGAERFIAEAAKLDLRDPDVPYCMAEIFRDTDRKRALDAIETYLHMTEFTADARSTKQRRVLDMREAIRKCLDEKTPPPCPGRFEHEFDSVRKAAERLKQRAEDDEKVKNRTRVPDGQLDPGMAGEGGGPGGPPALPPGWSIPPGYRPPPGWNPSQGPPPGVTPPPGWKKSDGPPKGWGG
jgi:tetratricopeptide (TPR) repeat protein